MHRCFIAGDSVSAGLGPAGLPQGRGYEVTAATNAVKTVAVHISLNDIQIDFAETEMPGSMDGLKPAAAVRGSKHLPNQPAYIDNSDQVGRFLSGASNSQTTPSGS